MDYRIEIVTDPNVFDNFLGGAFDVYEVESGGSTYDMWFICAS